ncbi:MAG TPA: esterase, partial [Thermoanaerobaculia bacterium]
MRRLGTVIAFCLVAVLQSSAQSEGTIRYLKLHSPALEKNLLGEPSDQEVAVYLPPDYDRGTARYPVLYLLHG